MDLRSTLNGYNPVAVLILPMLGRRTNEYPRYRDCYVTEDERIAVVTQCGGKFREKGFGEEELYEDPNFVRTYDVEENTSYGIYEFDPPAEWSGDFYHIMQNEMPEVSDEYIAVVKEFYPRLAESGRIDIAFGRKKPAARKKARK